MTSDKWRVTGRGKTLAVQDFERHRTVADRDLLGEEDRAHAARAQAADDVKTAGQSGGKIGVDLDSRVRGNDAMEAVRGKRSAVARTELDIIRVGLLASVADLHERQ